MNVNIHTSMKSSLLSQLHFAFQVPNFIFKRVHTFIEPLCLSRLTWSFFMCHRHTSSPLIGQSCYLTSEEGKRSKTEAGAGVAGVRAV